MSECACGHEEYNHEGEDGYDDHCTVRGCRCMSFEDDPCWDGYPEPKLAMPCTCHRCGKDL